MRGLLALLAKVFAIALLLSRSDFAGMLDLMDGGFQPMVALFVAFVMGAELTRQHPAMRRPLVVAVRDIEGRTVHINSLTTKPLVVNLWATWCPPCRREMTVLRDAQRGHSDIVFVFLSQGGSAASIRGYLAAQHIDIDNVLSDPLGTFAQQTGSYAYPTSLFFDDKGELTQHSPDERLRMLDPQSP